MKHFFSKIFSAFLVTGITLGVLSLLQEGVVRLDKIVDIWITLLFIAIPVIVARLGYLKYHIPRLFSWLLTSLFFIITFFVFNPLNLLNYIEQDKIYKQQAANQPPPDSLSIGGIGPIAVYYWDSNLETIPPGYHYKRTDLRGYKIYVPRSASIIQWQEPKQYNEVVVENPGKWVSLYKAKMPYNKQ